ncbi:MAG: type II secretion system protein GspE, partial [Thermoanaerobaculia bacterium]|nr:type II secretion system protein GspE [Thermoanaerobaculia bacterium]
STINRLMNMGIEPFLVATSVQLIAAQRLVRRICVSCKEEVELTPQALANIGYTKEEIATSFKVYKGRGCDKCGATGYKGRVGLVEVMVMTDELREMVLSGASAIELKRRAVEGGMFTLRRSGLYKIMKGITTIEEVVRETVL